MNSTEFRIERDSMGEVQVPASCYYGASTARALENFPISGQGIPKRMIRALGLIKGAAARANADLGLLPEELAGAIAAAAREVADGRFDDDFVVDIFQTGSGTSSNMNTNEVIANRAAELLGAARGSRHVVHPNDHVNLGQSSNDVIPTAIHVAALLAVKEVLEPGLAVLLEELERQSKVLWDTIKTGRTHMQDATPIRLGQVFRGYAGQIERSERRTAVAANELREVALGGTAVGTGINTHPDFARRVVHFIGEDTGIAIRETGNHFQAQAAIDGMVAASGALRTVAVSLMKIANDLRLMASGPRAGLAELNLPEVQPGSSIMPGKVNPVIVESAVQAAAQVVANDLAVVQAGQWGFFELNTMLPLAGRNLLESIELLGATAENLALRCVRDLEATTAGPQQVEQGLAIVTGLVPLIGYDRAATVAKLAGARGITVREAAESETELTKEQLDEALDPFRMTEPL